MTPQTYVLVELQHPRLGLIKVNEQDVAQWLADGCTTYGGDQSAAAPVAPVASVAPVPEVIPEAPADAPQDAAPQDAAPTKTKGTK